MIVKALSKIAFLCGLIIFLSSCMSYDEVEISDIKTIQILEAGNGGIKLQSEIKIKNPNFYSIEVTNSSFDVYIKNKKVGTAYIDSELKLASNSNEYKEVKMVSTFDESNTDALTTVLGSMLFGNREVDFKVDGFVEGKALLVKKKIHLSHAGKVPISMLQY